MGDWVLMLLSESLSAFLTIWPEGRAARIVSVILHLLIAIFIGLCVGAAVANYHDEITSRLCAIGAALLYALLIGWWIYRRMRA